MWAQSRGNLPVSVAISSSRPTAATPTSDGRIRYEWDWDFESPSVVADQPDYEALCRFRRLGDGPGGAANAKRIANFAAKYGPLCLPGADFNDRPDFETVADWRRWARTADAIVRISLDDLKHTQEDYDHLKANFRQVRNGFPQNERVPGSKTRGGFVRSHARTRDTAMCMQLWLATAQVQISFSWPEDAGEPLWRVTGQGLLGSLAFQTVEALRLNVTEDRRTQRLKFDHTCWHCRTIFQPVRRRNPKQRHFCDQCSAAGWPQRYRDSDNNARRRGKRHR